MPNIPVLSGIIVGLENVVNDILDGLPDLRDSDEYCKFVKQVQTCRKELLTLNPDIETIHVLGTLFSEVLDLVTQESTLQYYGLQAHETWINPN